MAGVSGAGESLVLNALLTAPIYVSLHSGDPGNVGSSEISGGGYARQSSGTWTATGNNPTVDSNSAIIAWPAATLDWGTVNYFGLWTAATSGTFLGGAALTTPRTILANDVARFLVGALTVSAD